MRPCELCIQIIIRMKKDKNEKSEGGRGWTGERESVKKERIIFVFFFFSLLLFQIYGNRIVGFRRSKRQSWSTRRELRVGTKSLVFCQTPRGRKFSYLCYFYPKCHLMAWDFLRGCERP